MGWFLTHFSASVHTICTPKNAALQTVVHTPCTPGNNAMAINTFCTSCKTSNGLDAKKCSKCGNAFGRDKKYRVSVSVKGNRVTRVADNLTIAREVEAAIKGDLVRDEYDIATHRVEKVTTLDDLWARTLPWAKEHKRTWQNDAYLYGKHIQPRLGDKALGDIAPLDVERLKSDMRKATTQHGKPFTNASIKHVLVLLKRLFNLAIKWNLFQGLNPVSRVEFPKLNNARTDFLSTEQIDDLLQVLSAWPCHESANIVRLLLFTGWRRSEVFALQWGDIESENRMVTHRNPKPGKSVTVPVSEVVLGILGGMNKTADYVFPGKGGKMRVDFKGPWERIRKAAGLPRNITLHLLRHTFASHLIMAGESLFTVGRLLGHRNTSTTARYSHLSDSHMQEAARRSADLLAGKQTGKKELRLVR
jgi:integrase